MMTKSQASQDRLLLLLTHNKHIGNAFNYEIVGIK